MPFEMAGHQCMHLYNLGLVKIQGKNTGLVIFKRATKW
jgi:hypothetical protein